MELIALLIVIGFLILFIVFKEILTYKERDLLTKKLMSKDFIDYSNHELAMKDEKKTEKQEKIIF